MYLMYILHYSLFINLLVKLILLSFIKNKYMNDVIHLNALLYSECNCLIFMLVCFAGKCIPKYNVTDITLVVSIIVFHATKGMYH